jgi:lipoprotein-anchoring transpeptidase ErfK/SrfK
MHNTLSRRNFLLLGGLALSGLAFTPVFPRREEQDQGELARVAIKEIDLRAYPNDKSAIIGKRYRDQVIHIYEELIPEDAPKFYNPLWYRVWGGYIHSAHLQRVRVNLNVQPLIPPESGQLVEVTVPYTVAYQQTNRQGWIPWKGARLYYETIHWATGVTEGPDGEPWYQLTNELSDSEIYYVPAVHLRPIAMSEITPLSPEVPAEQKRIEVDLGQQTLMAFEYEEQVFSCRISSGIPSAISNNGIPTATPKGRFRIYSKLPSKHMGSVTGNPDALEASGGFSLPGVPWTCFFAPNGGVAFHGTYWHTNFGLQMSHGCVNMRNDEAKWLFRWATPVFASEIKSHADWEKTGNGTQVMIY